MMPIIFTILGVCIGIKLPKALKSGLLVGVGFVGLSVVTALLTSSLGPALSKMVEIYGLELGIFDMGWPSAAAVAYNTSVGAFIIPVCLGVNLLMLLTKTTRTVNIDLWNYWHFAFIGAIVYFASDNIYWGFFAAILAFYTNGRSVCLTELKGYQAAVGEPVIQPRRPNSRLDKVRHMFSKIT